MMTIASIFDEAITHAIAIDAFDPEFSAAANVCWTLGALWFAMVPFDRDIMVHAVATALDLRRRVGAKAGPGRIHTPDRSLN